MSTFMAEVVGTAILILLGDGVVAAVGRISGAHLNPAVTAGLASIGSFPWAQVPSYILAQMIGAIIGATLVWLMYLPHWEQTEDKATKLGVVCTAPAIRDTKSNLISEIIGTFMLLFGILFIGENPAVGPLLTGLLIVSIGLSLGAPTGYAINPTRDLGSRIAHAILPIAGKGGNDWEYSWIPVVGPIIGGVLGTLAFALLF